MKILSFCIFVPSPRRILVTVESHTIYEQRFGLTWLRLSKPFRCFVIFSHQCDQTSPIRLQYHTRYNLNNLSSRFEYFRRSKRSYKNRRRQCWDEIFLICLSRSLVFELEVAPRMIDTCEGFKSNKNTFHAWTRNWVISLIGSPHGASNHNALRDTENSRRQFAIANELQLHLIGFSVNWVSSNFIVARKSRLLQFPFYNNLLSVSGGVCAACTTSS